MLQPFLLVGVGGSGGKTLRALRHSLELRLQQEDWQEGWPNAWQMLHVDSPVTQDGASFPAPFLPSENYFPLVAPGTTYKQAYGSVMANIPVQYLADIEKALPSDEDVNVDINIGAGKFRGVGRTLALARLKQLTDQITESFAKMTSDGAISQLDSLGRKLGAKPAQDRSARPIIIVVSSIAGGSGAGQYIDVAEAIKFAKRNDPSVNSIFSILYAPDVFKSVGNTDVIAPNALFAMAESMAGMWSRDIPPASWELYRKMGLEMAGRGDAATHIGPRFNYVIGRQNSNVTFSDQPDVYKAVSASLATWLTDENVQDGLQAYTVANYGADMGALNLTDNSGLQVANVHTPPFGSLGFGRVGLGRDRFTDYTAERLTRTAIDRMLNAHNTESDSAKTPEQLVEVRANQSVADFLDAMSLSKRSDSDIDAILAMKPQRDALFAEFKASLLEIARQGVSAKTQTQSAQAWSDLLLQAYQMRLDGAVATERQMRDARTQQWVAEIRLRTRKVVARAISQQGIKVAVELINRLDAELKSQVTTLQGLQNAYAANAANPSTWINASLSAVQGGQGLQEDHPSVQEAAEQGKNCLWNYLDGLLHGSVATMLEDYANNYLRPLKDELISGEAALLKLTDRQNQSDLVQNAFDTWPKPNSSDVPPKYDPAPNEFLLVETSEFPNEYQRLIQETVADDRRDNARGVVVDEVLMGSLELDALEPNQSWELITEERPWIPLESFARADKTQAQQSARFHFATQPEDYLKRTHMWLQIKGRAFYKYLHEDLANYLDSNIHDPSVIVDRVKKFREQFNEAVDASEPLVKLNPGLLQELHNSSIDERDTVISVLPFERSGQLYEIIKNKFVRLLDSSGKGAPTFDSSARVQNIDIFSVQRPYQPMVMDSIFNPIASSWNGAQNSSDKREDFLKWRRGRPLFDAIPAAPEKKRAMIRGWYVARTLGQLKETFDPLLGPHIEVWSAKDYTFEGFPYPLALKGIAEPQDYPGAILNSLVIALSKCNSDSSLKPLRAYQRLVELGEIDNVSESTLAQWITRGTMRFDHQPLPDPNRAGSPQESADERRNKVKTYLEKLSADFAKAIEGLDPRQDWAKMGLTWELRAELRSALNQLLAATDQAAEVESGI